MAVYIQLEIFLNKIGDGEVGKPVPIHFQSLQPALLGAQWVENHATWKRGLCLQHIGTKPSSFPHIIRVVGFLPSGFDGVEEIRF